MVIKRYYIFVCLYLALLAPPVLGITACRPAAFIEVTPESLSPIATPGPINNPIVQDNEWPLYQDPDLGYSFSYPPDTYLKSGRSKFGTYTTHLQFHLPGVTGHQGMIIRIESNPQDLPLEKVLAQLYEQSAQEAPEEELLSQVESTTVAGLPAIQTSILPTNTDFAILFLYQGNIYILAPVHDSAVTAVAPEGLDLFYRVVHTFRVNP